MVKKIIHNSEILAIIIPHDYWEPGIHFFTPNEFSQQLAFMRHPAGKVIDPHYHNPVPREISFTQEALFLRRGKLRVDIYDKQKNYLESHVLTAGDVILLASGGHGFEVIEEIDMIEVKQGPYAGVVDKTHFTGIGSPPTEEN